MTMRKWSSLYEHYKNNYDFRLSGIGYGRLEEQTMKDEEWF